MVKNEFGDYISDPEDVDYTESMVSPERRCVFSTKDNHHRTDGSWCNICKRDICAYHLTDHSHGMDK